MVDSSLTGISADANDRRHSKFVADRCGYISTEVLLPCSLGTPGNECSSDSRLPRAQTPAFAISQRARRKVEALFAELKNYVGLRRLRLRRMRFVRERFYLAATAQNLKRLVRFLSRKPEPQLATA